MEQNEIIQEFSRRYQDSYIWVVPPNTSEESLFYVEKVTPDAEKLAVLSLSSPEFGRIIINMATTHTLKFKYPPVGVFQKGKDAYIFRRYPAKQYKHGIYHGNSQLYPVFADLRGMPHKNNELSFEEVDAAFKAETFSYRDAIALLKSGKYRSVALKQNFSLMLAVDKKVGYTLLYWETPVASITDDGSVERVYESAFTKVLEAVKGR